MSKSSKSILEIMELTLLPLATVISKDSDSEVMVAGCHTIAKSFSNQLVRNPELVQTILGHASEQTAFTVTLVSALHDALYDPLHDNFSTEVRHQIAGLADLIPKPEACAVPMWEFWRDVLAMHPLLHADGSVDEKALSKLNLAESPVLRPWSELSSF